MHRLSETDITMTHHAFWKSRKSVRCLENKHGLEQQSSFSGIFFSVCSYIQHRIVDPALMRSWFCLAWDASLAIVSPKVKRGDTCFENTWFHICINVQQQYHSVRPWLVSTPWTCPKKSNFFYQIALPARTLLHHKSNLTKKKMTDIVDASKHVVGRYRTLEDGEGTKRYMCTHTHIHR